MATDTSTDLGLAVLGPPRVPWQPAGRASSQETGRPRPAGAGARIAGLLEDAVLAMAAGVIATGLLIMSYGLTMWMQGR